MKSSKKLFVSLISIFTLVGCSTESDTITSLQTSLNNSIEQLSHSINTITLSEGYQALSISKSSSTTNVRSLIAASDSSVSTIALSDIQGIYEYKPTKSAYNQNYVLFSKTGANSDMIVKLPRLKVQNPYLLYNYIPSDTILNNNYTIDVSAYNYQYQSISNWTYKCGSSIQVDNTPVGSLAIQSSETQKKGYKYQSDFVFSNGYKISCTYNTGDTALIAYAITTASKNVYIEKYKAYKNSSSKHIENEYSLTIGEIELSRKMGKNSLDSVCVFMSGKQQKNVKVEIIDNNVDEINTSYINKNRDLKITFSDGTSTTISALLANDIDSVRQIFNSLIQATFATQIIDWIAIDIYNNKK